MDQLHIIGLVGATGSGKTTLANMMEKRLGFERLHMGQPIKDMLKALGLTDEQLTGPPEVRSIGIPLLAGKSPRYAMQTLGTGWGRKLISEGIWAHAVSERLAHKVNEGSRRIVIDDLRFPNDWRVIVEAGGTVIKVKNPNTSKKRSLGDRIAQKSKFIRFLGNAMRLNLLHETEFHWYDAPSSITILNDGSTDDLFETFRKQYTIA